MTIRWFFSGTVRHVTELWKHVRKMASAQRDILSSQASAGIDAALQETKSALDSGASKDALEKQAAELEKAATKWLKPYPNAGWRENVEVLLVAVAVAMGIRTFFLQPFKIPTGSMQPTLFGVTPSPGEQPEPADPHITGFKRFVNSWVYGISEYHEIAQTDGRLEEIKPPATLKLFNLWQEYNFAGTWHRIWFPEDQVFERAGLYYNHSVIQKSFRKGEDILNLAIKSGDHLFVDRLSYNFRHPRRGEIIVFQTKGIQSLPQDQFYIKRLVGLGSERISIGRDRHVRINGQRLAASTPHFENVYSFDPRVDALKNHYSGHVPMGNLAEGSEWPISAHHYFALGDNTLNSYDSRGWGDFPEENVIGKPFFIYWPISSRFGWGYR